MSARRWSAPGWAVLLAVGGLALAAPDLAVALQWVPLLVGLVLFVLPHGAVDHHVPRRLHRAGGRRFIAAYLAAVGAGLLLWAVAPVATLIAFLLVAALHWGSGDGWFARAAHGRAPFRGRLDAGLFVAARGALPVALPALAHPAELARGADAILGTVGGGVAPELSDGARAAGLAAVGLLVAAAAVSSIAAAHGRPGGLLVDLGELALLAGFFVLTPAILAVGTYLLAWHAPRHIARLIAADPVQAALPPARALSSWTREAAPLTLLSLAGLALLATAAWRVPATGEAVAGAALALIAALTFPHAAVVAWMDREQAVFARSGARLG
jgi:Brp/Blh family beta-carotene 15,15'-monooxygenase